MDYMLGTSTPLLRRNTQHDDFNMNNKGELVPMITTRRRGSLVKKTLFTDNASVGNHRFDRQRPPQRASAAMALTNWKNQMHLYNDAEASAPFSPSGSMTKKRRHFGKQTKAKTSLYLLTLQFLDMLSRDGLVNLNKASILLGAKKRRLYDITCVLYAMGYVCKPMKNFVEYRHIDHPFSDGMELSTTVSFSHQKEKSVAGESTKSSNYVSLSQIDDGLYKILRNDSYDYEDGYITIVLSGVNMNCVHITRDEDNQVEMEIAFLSEDPSNVIFWQETSFSCKSSVWHKVQIFQIELGFRPLQEYVEEIFSGEHTTRPFTELYLTENFETPLASIPMEDSAAYLDDIEVPQDLFVSLLDDEEKESSGCDFDTFHCLSTPVKSKA